MTTATKPSFVYVTFIATTAEKVWRAIIDPEVAREYWTDPTKPAISRVNVSDWVVGSRWEHQRYDETKAVDVTGKVIEIDPPHRLVISWARPGEFDDETKHSRVTFLIEQSSESVVKLTVLHEDLEKDEKMFAGISSGWPMILSNLKTLLETDRPLRERQG